MLRFFLAPVALGLILLACAAAPVPKGTGRPVLYYPTAVGTKRVYQWGNGVSFTTVITEAKAKDGKWVVRTSRVKEDSNPDPHNLFEAVVVSEKGVSYGAVSARAFQPPLPWLKIPAKAGDAWDSHLLPDYPGDSESCSGRMSVGGIEKVEVPAGTFECIRVDGRGERDGKLIEERRWYAPGAGLVKCVNGSGDILVLKSFTPGP